MTDHLPAPDWDSSSSGWSDTRMLSAREAAGVLGVNERTIRRAIARHQLSATKVRGIYHISSRDLMHYDQERRFSTGSIPHASPAVSPLVAFPSGQRAPGFHLPRPPLRLIGREAELETVLALLGRDDVPLVTLLRPGGVGKTRLAIAAARATTAFPDGTCFVSLAPIRDANLVGAEIARAMGVLHHGMRPLAERLGPALQGKRVLLLLDNFEHVIDAAPLVSGLLDAFPGLTGCGHLPSGWDRHCRRTRAPGSAPGAGNTPGRGG